MKLFTSPFIIFAVALAAIYGADKLSMARPYLGAVAAVVFLYIPIILLFVEKKTPAFYGIRKKGAGKSIARALGAAGIIFPVYCIGFYLSMRYIYHLDIGFPGEAFLYEPHTLLFVVNLLLMVAIPEEVFYRGYIESELRQKDKRTIRLFGVRTGASFFIVNMLFAAGHLVLVPDIARLAVFFPGLVMSWLREKDDNIAGSVVFHWLSDVLAFLLFATLR